MGWNYRKRIKVAPGVTMNLGKNGVSTTVGKRGMSVTSGKNGTYLNTGIPGSGLYNRQKISSGGGGSSGWGMPDNGCLTSCSSCFVMLLSLFLFLAGIFLVIINFADTSTADVESPISFTLLSLAVVMVLPFIRMFRRNDPYRVKKPPVFSFFSKLCFACGLFFLGIGIDGPANLIVRQLLPGMGPVPAKTFLVLGIILLAIWIYLHFYDRLSPFFKQLFTRFRYGDSDLESYDDDDTAETQESPRNPEPATIPTPVGAPKPRPDSDGGNTDFGGLADRDPLFEDAARFVISSQTVTTSSLQERFSIDYNRAGRIMNQMEAAGIVGQWQQGGTRQVLMDSIELERLLEGDQETPPSEKNPTTTSGNPLPDTLFKDIVTNVGMLYIYLQTASKNAKALKSLNFEFLEKCKDWTFTVDYRLAIVVMHDLETCYRNLGYDMPANEGENVAITLFTLKLVSRKEISPSREELMGEYYQMTKRFLASFSDSFKSPVAKDKLILSEAFKDGGVDNQLTLRYLTLIYELASTLAKVDGKISLEESTFLGKLLQEISEVSAQEKKAPAAHPAKTRKTRAERELDGLIGMASVKEEVQKVASFVKVQQMRIEKGMSTSPISYHCVFTGNPGTGKTTVARILAGIYRDLGVLEKGHLVETDRSGLVAEYVGQTAVKTNKIIDSAIGGVLFIDEAYSLVSGSSNDYGREAIATRLKRMEDDRDKLVVILAGYGNEMKKFIDSNPGLQSRFNRYINFPDYSAPELMQIFDQNINKLDYSVDAEARLLLEKLFETAVGNKDQNFGNGRYVRNIEEKILENQATRLSAKEDITEEDLRMLTREDIPQYKP